MCSLMLVRLPGTGSSRRCWRWNVGAVGIFGGIEGLYTYSAPRTWGAVLVCPAGLAGLCLPSACSPDASSAPEAVVEPHQASLTTHLKNERFGRGPVGNENRTATLCGNRLQGSHFLTALDGSFSPPTAGARGDFSLIFTVEALSRSWRELHMRVQRLAMSGM
ncbi:uncharacterized protein LOC111177462 isoform X2 [Delphinapterus leucas]|uniref:Uncharacterized protein LOC111177462 isoform X2 n=1 Tax=Delphinapterus leucas TaxID=9749 RepID=A0A7F8K806_DELLE|nr:uncharacterized protein LOC111177462 isoform X2 [Delphinapterus leucas]